MKRIVFALSSFCLLSAANCNAQSNSTNPQTLAAVSAIVSPSGYSVEKLPAILSAPRFLTFSAGGDMIVGSNSGSVYRLKAPYTQAEVLVDFGSNPHSVALRSVGTTQELWIAVVDGVFKAPYDPASTLTRADFTKVVSLPGGGGHVSRTVKISPENEVYVSLGISNNCSLQYLDASFPENNRRGGIYKIDETATPAQLVPFGRGLRNPVGFSWQPETSLMYANNNGPDHLGFNEPREVFVEVKQNSFFGMPWYQYINGEVVVDTCASAVAAPAPITSVEIPVATFDARSAPMEVQFVGKSQLNPAWEGSAIVALRGSWGVPAGGGSADRRHPKIVLVEFADGKATGDVTDLFTGFQDADGTRIARPVGLAIGPDNALYFTSDAEGEGVYRVIANPVGTN